MEPAPEERDDRLTWLCWRPCRCLPQWSPLLKLVSYRPWRIESAMPQWSPLLKSGMTVVLPRVTPHSPIRRNGARS